MAPYHLYTDNFCICVLCLKLLKFRLIYAATNMKSQLGCLIDIPKMLCAQCDPNTSRHICATAAFPAVLMANSSFHPLSPDSPSHTFTHLTVQCTTAKEYIENPWTMVALPTEESEVLWLCLWSVSRAQQVGLTPWSHALPRHPTSCLDYRQSLWQVSPLSLCLLLREHPNNPFGSRILP